MLFYLHHICLHLQVSFFVYAGRIKRRTTNLKKQIHLGNRLVFVYKW